MAKLAKSTREDYLEAFDYLRPEFDIVLEGYHSAGLSTTCATTARNEKWPRFADQMIAALSSMFRQAVKRGKMPFNPCLGMDKAHKADPNANREWLPEEWQFARENAPLEIKIPLMLARYAGLRGQTIVAGQPEAVRGAPAYRASRAVQGAQEQQVRDPPGDAGTAGLHGRAEGAAGRRPDRRPRRRHALGRSEKEMQTRVSHWLRDQERAGHIGAGTTLHGLRVSYAAWWRRNGANDARGGRSDRRHVGTHGRRTTPGTSRPRSNIIRAFTDGR